MDYYEQILEWATARGYTEEWINGDDESGHLEITIYAWDGDTVHMGADGTWGASYLDTRHWPMDDPAMTLALCMNPYGLYCRFAVDGMNASAELLGIEWSGTGAAGEVEAYLRRNLDRIHHLMAKYSPDESTVGQFAPMVERFAL